jgi:hypothetical protein
MLNVGFTLVYHTSVDDGDDWIGRTVNMIFFPGVCSASRVVPPSIQWTTMPGGKVKDAEIHSIGLLDIDAITISNIRNSLDAKEIHVNDGETKEIGNWFGSEKYEDDLDCFFTITSKHGEVYLFEALSIEESRRIVTGIKNLAYRLNSQIIAGEARGVAEFFDNSQEPPGTQLGVKEAMLKISNDFLDNLL